MLVQVQVQEVKYLHITFDVSPHAAQISFKQHQTFDIFVILFLISTQKKMKNIQWDYDDEIYCNIKDFISN